MLMKAKPLAQQALEPIARHGTAGRTHAHGQAQARVAGYSAADEVAKLAKLRDEGKITAEEYEDMKRKAMIQV